MFFSYYFYIWFPLFFSVSLFLPSPSRLLFSVLYFPFSGASLPQQLICCTSPEFFSLPNKYTFQISRTHMIWRANWVTSRHSDIVKMCLSKKLLPAFLRTAIFNLRLLNAVILLKCFRKRILTLHTATFIIREPSSSQVSFSLFLSLSFFGFFFPP